MKLSDVPQDHDLTYEANRKLCYAIDDHGHYVQATSDGWSAEETVKAMAWQVLDAELAEVLSQVKNGQASSLKYFMKLRQMDTKLLAQNVGAFAWRVKWHLRPKVFCKLNEQWLTRYSDCLEVSAELLRDFRG